MDEDYLVEGEVPEGRLSFSRIKTFRFCPEKFRLQYVEKARGLVRVPMVLGSNWHSGISHGIQRMIDRAVPKTREVVEKAVESLRIEMNRLKRNHRIDFTEFDPSAAQARDDLMRMAHHGFNALQKIVKPKYTERPHTVMLDAETPVNGVTDIEEEEKKQVGIVELKTTTRKPNDLLVFDWQEGIYQLMVPAAKWLKKFFVVRKKTKNRDIEIYRYLRKANSQVVQLRTVRDIQSTKEQIKAASVHGYPKTSDLQTCSWCAYRYGCRPEIFSHEDNPEKYSGKQLLFTTTTTKNGGK